MAHATPETIEARFWAKVQKSDGCWLWTRAKIAAGYGAFRANGELYYAHRYSYELHHGAIPPGETIDHACHVRACVNPAHIRLASYSQQNENRPYANRTGYRGVFQNRSGRGQLINTWTAAVQKDGKIHRSAHGSPEAAAEWARTKRIELFTHNDQDRRPNEDLYAR